MTSCPSCTLPNPGWRAECAFCAVALLGQTPMLARIVRDGDSFSLFTGDRLLAGARTVGEVVRVQAGDGTVHSMVALREETGTEVVLFDARLNVVASLREAGATLASSAVLRSADDEVLAIVRADGVGGMHVMGPDGTVLLFAGRSRIETGALDILVTDAGLARPLVILFALVVALETQKLGPLHAPLPFSGPGSGVR